MKVGVSTGPRRVRKIPARAPEGAVASKVYIGPHLATLRAMETTQQEQSTKKTGGKDVEKVHELLKGFGTLMMVTFEQTGTTPKVNARPMGVAQLEDDCTLWFITSKTSSKVSEAQNAGQQGHVVGQSKMEFVSLQGTFTIVKDQAKLAQLWTKAYEVWFPKGPTDPDVCLMHFSPAEAEVWDSSGVQGLKFMFEAAKALITGDTPKADKDQHMKVNLKH